MSGKQAFVARRLVQLGLSLVVTASFLFFLFRLTPGDPTASVVDADFTPEVVAALRREYGLDQPLAVQYGLYLRNAAQGEFGYSFFYKRPVTTVLGEKFWNTLTLMGASFLLAYGLGFVGGVFLAWKRGTVLEGALVTLALFFRAAPLFWTGMLALMVFAYWLQWFPNSGLRDPGYEAAGPLEKFVSLDFLHHLALPALISGLYFLGTPLLVTRNTMLEVVEEDFIDYARAKGLPEWQVMYRHAARNALLPLVTNAAIFIGLALGGQVLVEYVFGWPGLGRELVLAVQRRDYPVAQVGFFLLSVLVMLMNLVADLLYGYLDPRVVYK